MSVGHELGEKTITLNLADVKLTFLTPEGKPLEPPPSAAFVASNGKAKQHMFEIEGPGINPFAVKWVSLGRLDYSSANPLQVTVCMYELCPVCGVTDCAHWTGLNLKGLQTLKRFGVGCKQHAEELSFTVKPE